VAIDGPAGAGKSTIARILAKKLNIMYINTGTMYRAVAYKALQSDISPENINALIDLVDSLEMHFENDHLFVNCEDISEIITLPVIGNSVSRYAAVKEVREKLVELQRRISSRYSVIMDGRDIGTVVLKDAPFKFFLTASPEERAKRRFEELINKGISVSYEEILRDIIKRDYEDSHREIDPLKKAADAIEIDSTGISIDDIVEKLFNYIKHKCGQQ
jgi:cytidylate kinase